MYRLSEVGSLSMLGLRLSGTAFAQYCSTTWWGAGLTTNNRFRRTASPYFCPRLYTTLLYDGPYLWMANSRHTYTYRITVHIWLHSKKRNSMACFNLVKRTNHCINKLCIHFIDSLSYFQPIEKHITCSSQSGFV